MIRIAIIALLIIALLGFTACNNEDKKNRDADELTKHLEARLAQMQQDKVNEPFKQLSLGDPERTELQSLRKKFRGERDEFSGSTTYTHRAVPNPLSGKMLYGEVTTWGEEDVPKFHLYAFYMGTEMLRCDSVDVKVGKNVLSGHDPHPLHGAKTLYADLIKTEGLEAAEIGRAIAESAPAIVRVRMSGDGYVDFTLNAAQSRAVADTYRFWRLMGGNSQSWSR